MNLMYDDNSYHDEKVHKNVQKTNSDGMENEGIYTKEGNNVLRKNDTKTGYNVRLHFTQEDNNKIVEEVQKILIGTYIESLKVGGN